MAHFVRKGRFAVIHPDVSSDKWPITDVCAFEKFCLHVYLLSSSAALLHARALSLTVSSLSLILLSRLTKLVPMTYSMIVCTFLIEHGRVDAGKSAITSELSLRTTHAIAY